jgi:hypothetical protein
MAAFINAGRDAPAAPRPRAAVGAAFETPGERRPLEAVGAAFCRAFATWTAPTTNDSSHATPAVPLAAVFQNLPLELTAKCVMTAMGLRWKPICDKIRKHAYAIQNEQYLMPPLEYPVFEPVYWPEYGRVCYVITYVLEKGGRRRKRTYR